MVFWFVVKVFCFGARLPHHQYEQKSIDRNDENALIFHEGSYFPRKIAHKGDLFYMKPFRSHINSVNPCTKTGESEGRDQRDSPVLKPKRGRSPP